MTVTTTIVGRVLVATALAAVEMTAERCGSATRKGRQHGTLGRCHRRAPLQSQRGFETADDIAQAGR